MILSSTITGEDVVIRFYQLRNDEPEWINLEDLEDYKEEAILVIEVLNAIQWLRITLYSRCGHSSLARHTPDTRHASIR